VAIPIHRDEKSYILNKNNRFLVALLRGGKGRPVFRHGLIPTEKEPLRGGKMTVKDLFRVKSKIDSHLYEPYKGSQRSRAPLQSFLLS